MNYERLTTRNVFGEVTVSGKDDRDVERKYQKITNRLAELEDKIESGELVDISQKTIKPFVLGEKVICYEIWGVKAEEYPIECGLDTQEAAEARLKELQEVEE